MSQEQFNIQTFAAICLAWKAFCEAVTISSVDSETKDKWTREMYDTLFETKQISVEK